MRAANSSAHRLCIAPMMDYTDRHARYLLRLLSPRAWLYTEMVTAAAIVHGRAERLLKFSPLEHPVALQLGGSNPHDMATAAGIGEQFGYREININVGCPSDRVQSGRFGACLMAEPELVAECVQAMCAATTLPVTIKTRLGIDAHDNFEDLCRFVEMTAHAGCHLFIIHARKAWLEGLNPKENREIPPLDYARVYQLKREFPELQIILNGGIRRLEVIDEALSSLDGVMIGRKVFEDFWWIVAAERHLYRQVSDLDREMVLTQYRDYCVEEIAQGVSLAYLTRHLGALACGLPGARRFRRELAEGARQPEVTATLILEVWHRAFHSFA